MSTGVAAPSFVHDLETCVGCHACVVACANENHLAPGTSWRHIVTFNEPRWTGFPVYHLSLACNHCLDAPCLAQCPAHAIARDARTGAVLIDDGSCIGCRYCSWVCPYDAPRFDAGRGIMGKCTLCSHRLVAGSQPACVDLCPVGALRVGQHRDDAPRGVAGFPDRAIRPLIRFEPLRRRARSAPVLAALPMITPPATPAESPRKISFRSEWSLALFTFVAILLFGTWTGSLWRGGTMRPAPFLLAGGAAVLLSTLHLGRPGRAWRASRNWRTSWLSREVLTYSAFLGLAAIALLVAPGDRRMDWLVGAAGLSSLFCIDRVYSAMARTRRSALDEVEAVTAGAFLAGVFAGAPLVFVPLGALRVITLVVRVRGGTLGRLPATRVLVGWVAPLALWLAGGPSAGPLAVLLAVAGEAMDRAAFYDGLEIVTPRLQAARDFAIRQAG
jgi:Fe-S-cluster-containing dehydrogenase component